MLEHNVHIYLFVIPSFNILTISSFNTSAKSLKLIRKDPAHLHQQNCNIKFKLASVCLDLVRMYK